MDREQVTEELASISDTSSKQYRRLKDIDALLAKVNDETSAIERNLNDIDERLSTKIKKIAEQVDDTLRSHFRGILSLL